MELVYTAIEATLHLFLFPDSPLLSLSLSFTSTPDSQTRGSRKGSTWIPTRPVGMTERMKRWREKRRTKELKGEIDFSQDTWKGGRQILLWMMTLPKVTSASQPW